MKQKIISFGGPPRKRTPPEQARAQAGVRRRKRRTGRQTLHYLLILLAAVAVMLVLSLTVFFRIDKIAVTGSTRYAAEEIIAQSGVKVGDNLFRASESKALGRLTVKYPYVEGVKFRRSFPAKLTIEIEQAKPLGAVDTAAGYVVIGKTGRVLEIGAASLPDGVTVVTGMYLYNPQVGQVLGKGYTKEEKEEAEKEADAFNMLTYLVDAVNETGFDQITLVDFSDQLNMMIVYDNRLILELGTQMDLPYKLRFAQTVINDQLESSFEGTLDASMAIQTKEVYALPGNVAEELERRRLTVASKTEPSAQPAQQKSDDPGLEVIPGTAPVNRKDASASSSAPEEEVSSAGEDYLATIPGTGTSSSEASSDVSSAPSSE